MCVYLPQKKEKRGREETGRYHNRNQVQTLHKLDIDTIREPGLGMWRPLYARLTGELGRDGKSFRFLGPCQNKARNKTAYKREDKRKKNNTGKL